MLDSNNTPPQPSDSIQPATRLDVVASQISGQTGDHITEDGPKIPEVVIVEPAAAAPTQESSVRTPVDTDQSLDQLRQLADQAAAETDDEQEVESYLQIHDSSEFTTCFGVDPFAMSVDGEVPAMPTIPLVDAMTREILSRQNDGDQHGWRLMPFAPGQQPGSSDASTGENEADSPSGQSGADKNEVDLEKGNKDCFFAKPGDVVFVDGNLGFDHIDLSVYEIDHATFQPDAILLFVDAEEMSRIDPNVSVQPITIRHRGVGYAIFKGGVVVDL